MTKSNQTTYSPSSDIIVQWLNSHPVFPDVILLLTVNEPLLASINYKCNSLLKE